MLDTDKQLDYRQLKEIDYVADAFENAWRRGERPSIDSYLKNQPEQMRPQVFDALLMLELELRAAADEQPLREDYIERFPLLRDIIEKAFAANNANLATTQGSDAAILSEDSVPVQLGRYVIRRPIGRGGFGVVYLAHDPQLDRLVALKVPRRESFNTEQQFASFIQEARNAAKLKHPLLVAVHDVQELDGLPCIIQEFIDGDNLAAWSLNQQPSIQQIVKILIRVADAIGYAHQQGLTHCDLKLANVLIDKGGQPHVADFGLAIHQDLRLHHKGERFGTPAMMAPEQVRGEGHRLDGRTDIWALGVMLYELLTRQRPFAAETQTELFSEIETLDPKPLRQIDRQVPRELERICLKCLSKRRTDRYSTTDDLREELELWLAQASTLDTSGSSVTKAAPLPIPESDSASKPPPKIIPKGLRSFDAEDADFFLQLLPGPRDRDDLPESIRFWKAKIEQTDADKTFTVGLIYGPSGCGKTSLVKAGLLPRLSDSVLPIYIEATPTDTEVRILKQLRKYSPRVSEGQSLPDAFSTLRTTCAGRQRKLLIVIDQFEQWLYSHQELKQAQLVNALRQCDGERLQAMLMIRTDFHDSVHRLFHELECPLVEANNYALIDRFDKQHARKVLIAFGHAYGKLPNENSSDGQQFVAQAVDELAEDGKVIGVRLSLFADMLKLRPWTVESLRAMGGVGGVGVTFLEETFSSKNAPPSHRAHEQAIRQVLKILLPDAAADIKGYMRSVAELREASGYQSDVRRFNEVLRILDSELRIVTPTEPDGREKSDGSNTSNFGIETSKFFQLTHDYLVPPLRDWLTRKQRETRKGRAELKLAERSSAWASVQESKQLPTMWEWLSIRILMDHKTWTDPQRAMMTRATRLHETRSGLAILGMIALTVVGLTANSQIARQREATRIHGLVGQLVKADPNQLAGIIDELAANKSVACAYLSPLVADDANTIEKKRSQLHARLAMVADDPALREPLLEELLSNKIVYVGPIRQQLRPWATELTQKFAEIMRDDKADAQRRFRAALVLADYAPASERDWWTERDLNFVAEQLVAANAEFQPALRDYLRPIRSQLLRYLEKIFVDTKGTESQRQSAAKAFADYAASDTAKLSQLLAVSTPEQHSVLFPLVAANPSTAAIEILSQIAATLPAADLGSVARIPFGQRRANAAVTLLRMGQREKVLPVFDMTDDPEALSQFIFRCRPLGVGVEALLDLLDIVTRKVSDGPTKVALARDGTPSLTVAPGSEIARAHYALLLALGEFNVNEIPEPQREPLLKRLGETYRSDPSSGVHGAAGWLLRKWGQREMVREIDQTPIPYSPDREWFTMAITVTQTKNYPELIGILIGNPKKTFHYTFIVFQPSGSEIGSVADESDRQPDELRRRVTITRPYALLDREITFEELFLCAPHNGSSLMILDSRPNDAGWLSWYSSVEFCRGLAQQSGLAESDQSYAAPETIDKQTDGHEVPRMDSWAPRKWPLKVGRRGFRLPTESEWEFASRNGARTSYGHGSDASLLGQFGWFVENSAKHLHRPRELRPNIRGLFDMQGNLFEWTNDGYAGDNLLRLSRGGCWKSSAEHCRSSFRSPHADLPQSFTVGLRLALSLSIDQSNSDKSQ